MTDQHKKIISIVSLVAALVFTVVVGWIVGRPMLKFVSDPEQFRLWVDAHGIWSRLAFIGMVMLQVIIALIPGEPLEIGAGYAFGAVEGTLLCMAGITLGSILIFVLVRRFGVKLVEAFFSVEKIHSLKFLQNEKRLTTISFIVFLLPGTPKDLLSYFAGLTPMRLSTWIVIASVARIPSIVTSTVGGSALSLKNYTTAIVVFALTVAVSIGGWLLYNRICCARQGENENADRDNHQ